MASMLHDCKVDVHVFYRSSFKGQRIWAEHDSDAGGTEAKLKHLRSDAYFMEVSERGSSKVVQEIDFRKIKSYKMRTRCWHEVKYDGRLFALRFSESETYDKFFETLELVLKLHRKFAKPKNDAAFLEEVQMFQLKKLRPVANVRAETASSLGTAETDSPISRGPLRVGRLRLNISKSLGIPVREKPVRLLENNKPSVDITKTPKPPVTPKKCKKTDPSDAAGGTVTKTRPLPQVPPTSKPTRSPLTPPPRLSGCNQNAQQGAVLDSVSTTPNPGTTDTSDEESDGCPSRENSPDYTPSAVYTRRGDEACQPPPSRDDPQHKPKSPNNQTSSGKPPPVAQAPKHQKPKQHPESQTPVRSTNPSQSPEQRTGRPGLNQPSPSPKPSANPLGQQDFQQSPSTIYGMAMAWQCRACTLRNEFSSMNCAACDRIRTDAWGCTGCSKVYSNDVSRCFTCNVWRCQLCFCLNRGTPNETTLCEVCGQR